MLILGISAYYHDCAAALIRDGESWPRRRKSASPARSTTRASPTTRSRLPGGDRHAPSAIDFVAFYDKPFLKFERLLETYLAFAPRGFSSFAPRCRSGSRTSCSSGHLLQEPGRCRAASTGTSSLLFSEHHLSHAASAFYPSPFDSAAVLTMDGVGEWTTTSVASARAATCA